MANISRIRKIFKTHQNKVMKKSLSILLLQPSTRTLLFLLLPFIVTSVAMIQWKKNENPTKVIKILRISIPKKTLLSYKIWDEKELWLNLIFKKVVMRIKVFCINFWFYFLFVWPFERKVWNLTKHNNLCTS